MAVPAEHQWLFWDVNPAAIDLARDRRYVLGRALERGRLKEVRWAVALYGLEGVREFFRTGGHPELSHATRTLWQRVLNEGDEAWATPPSWRNDNAAPWID